MMVVMAVMTVFLVFEQRNIKLKPYVNFKFNLINLAKCVLFFSFKTRKISDLKISRSNRSLSIFLGLTRDSSLGGDDIRIYENSGDLKNKERSQNGYIQQLSDIMSCRIEETI